MAISAGKMNGGENNIWQLPAFREKRGRMTNN